MGKIWQLSLGLMFTFLVLGLFFTAMETESPDENKTTFTRYAQYDTGGGELLNEGNVTYQDTNDTITNFEWIAWNMQEGIAGAQQQLLSGSPVDLVLGTYGLITTLIMNTMFVLLAVIVQAVNMVFGIGDNLKNLPAPWMTIGDVFVPFALALVTVYIVYKLINAYKGYDACLLYTSPSPRDRQRSRMPSSA